ncbi:MAG: RsmB/NOP family class I SAM-dependent RNA methyltransferase [Candidatus Jordarchaeales archaeon]|nr:RsmB/NOP family class I SAM-dependent RNA methyltransferase [Candidatus Jordarchaeia archaeon]
MTVSREVAAEVLRRFEDVRMKGSLRSLIYGVIEEFNVSDVKVRTSAFGLVVETVKRMNTVDFILQRAVGGKEKFRSLDPFVRNLLRVATLELKISQSPVDVERKVYGLLLRRAGKAEAAEARRILKRVKAFSLEEALKRRSKLEKLSILYSHPSFFIKRIMGLLGEGEALELMKANLSSKVIWFRVNRLKMNVEDALATFERDGVRVEGDKDFPALFRLVDAEIPLPLTPYFDDRRIIVQDKASVAAVYALDPRPGERVLDACAAPGMKTALIAELMEGEGELTAVDISAERARRMERILDLSGASNVKIMVADSRTLTGEYDKVLVDAPCTSSGTFASTPEAKWKLDEKQIGSYTSIQKALLENALKLVREGGVVVYSVCSIFPEEGEEVVDSVLGRAELIELSIPGEKGYDGFECSSMVKRFFPHKHQTNGFFIAKLAPA